MIKKILYTVDYLKDLYKFRKQFLQQEDFKRLSLVPIVMDKYDSAGVLSGAYFHQDILVAQKIFEKSPKRHVDIGSRIDGFIAHVASFREIEVFDIRAIKATTRNIIFRQADLMNLQSGYEDYCDSVSSLHAIEHFGLGRYGDSLDIDGHVKGLHHIHKILKPGGTFYFSVPIGRQRIDFNAHRVFDIKYLLELLEPYYIIKSFSYVSDAGDLSVNVSLNPESIESNCGCVHFGCGIFELIKK